MKTIPKGIIVTNNWCIEYDNLSILLLLLQKKTCTYSHACAVIKNEGGYVDSKGIIHKGNAENKISYIA